MEEAARAREHASTRSEAVCRWVGPSVRPSGQLAVCLEVEEMCKRDVAAAGSCSSSALHTA